MICLVCQRQCSKRGSPCLHSSAVPAAHSTRRVTLHRLSARSAKTSASTSRPRASRGRRWRGSRFRTTTVSANTSRGSSASARSPSSRSANEPCVWGCPRPSPCQGCQVGEAAGPLHQVLGGPEIGVTLIRGGGHFPGGSMLHWAAGAEGKGVVCSADMAIANLDRKSFSFMRSIPNFIPLSEKAVRAVGAALMPLAFDRVYSHHWERAIDSGAKQILHKSVERYVAAIGGAYDRA